MVLAVANGDLYDDLFEDAGSLARYIMSSIFELKTRSFYGV